MGWFSKKPKKSTGASRRLLKYAKKTYCPRCGKWYDLSNRRQARKHRH